jgi:hypothetical protein
MEFRRRMARKLVTLALLGLAMTAEATAPDCRNNWLFCLGAGYQQCCELCDCVDNVCTCVCC